MHKRRRRKKKLINKQPKTGSAKDVWGKVVLFLKEHHHVALHVACGDITDVEIAGDKLLITTPDKTVLSLLEDGKREIERALSWQGAELSVEIVQKVFSPTAADEDKAALQKMFGKKFKIIN